MFKTVKLMLHTYTHTHFLLSKSSKNDSTNKLINKNAKPNQRLFYFSFFPNQPSYKQKAKKKITNDNRRQWKEIRGKIVNIFA